MERLKERLEILRKSLKKLHEIAVKDEINEIERDVLLHRFEVAFEIMWKCGRDYLSVVERRKAVSPKSFIRHFQEIGLFDEGIAEQALRMVDDRNLIAHRYDEAFAQEITRRVVEYELLLWEWYRKIL